MQFACQVLRILFAVDAKALKVKVTENILKLEMWANVQRNGRPAKYRWRPLFNATKFG